MIHSTFQSFTKKHFLIPIPVSNFFAQKQSQAFVYVNRNMKKYFCIRSLSVRNDDDDIDKHMQGRNFFFLFRSETFFIFDDKTK